MQEKVQWEKLSEKDLELLLKAPMLISLLAASTDGTMDNKEKQAAMKLAHLRTFTAPKILQSYYKEVEKKFEDDFEKIILQYSPFDEKQQESIKNELDKAYKVLEKLGPIFKEVLRESFSSYAKHISEVHRNFLQYFLLPLNIPGVSD